MVISTNYFGTPGNDLWTGTMASETADGAGGNDTLDGAEGNDSLVGGTGNDSLIGGAGDDRFYGGDDNDLLFGGSGADTLNGDAGNDTYYIGSDSSDTLAENINAGIDTVDVLNMSYTLAANFEKLIVHSTDWQTLILTGNESNNVITALIDDGLANFSMYGAGGDDALTGNASNDYQSGGDGNDKLYGADGSDMQEGGNGNDQIFGGLGDDTVDGGAGNDTLYGSAGMDTVSGGAGNDQVDGNEGDDRLNGGDGNDNLRGGADNDTLTGLWGADTLQGGNGADIFQIQATLGSSGIDVISDFNSAQGDVLQISKWVTNLSSYGSLWAERFTTGASASEVDDRFVYDGSTGNLYYDADGSGAGAQVHFATFSNLAVLTASDIVII